MKIKTIKISGCKYKVEYSISKNKFEEELSSAFENLEKNNKTEGLNQGQFIEKNGMNELCSIAVNAILKDSLPQIIKDNKLSMLDYPVIFLEYTALDKDPINFHIEFEVYPDIELGKYFGLKIKFESTEVSDEEISKYVQEELKKHTTLIESKDKTLKNGHHAIFDFDGYLDGVAFEGGSARGYDLEIGSHMFIPGFEEQMVGMKVYEKKDIKVTFPDNYNQKELAGKETVFKLHLHEIKEVKYPELNDEFVKNTLKITNINTVKEYFEYVSNKLNQAKKRNSFEKARNDYLTQVINNAKLEVPNCMIDKQLDREMKRVEDMAGQYGLPVNVLLSYYGFNSTDEYKEKITGECIERIKYNLVINEIIEKENIEISEEEYNQELAYFASSNGQSVEQVTSTYPKEELMSSFIYNKAEKLLLDSAIVE